jgi:hypothetical protein
MKTRAAGSLTMKPLLPAFDGASLLREAGFALLLRDHQPVEVAGLTAVTGLEIEAARTAVNTLAKAGWFDLDESRYQPRWRGLGRLRRCGRAPLMSSNLPVAATKPNLGRPEVLATFFQALADPTRVRILGPSATGSLMPWARRRRVMPPEARGSRALFTER